MNWEQRLIDAGCRITAARRAVIQVLMDANRPLSPPEILVRGQKRHPKLGLATVYRTVELFIELKLAHRVHNEHECHRYLLASSSHSHPLVCSNCGKSVNFSCREALQRLIEHVRTQVGYQINSHLLQLFGRCPECQISAA